MLAMWSSFTSLRLGVRLRALDWALIGCILLLVPPVVSTRQNMADAESALAVVRYLQFASPFLLAIPAVKWARVRWPWRCGLWLLRSASGC